MSAPKHTPAPWGIEVPEYGAVITHNGGSIGAAYPEDMSGRPHDAVANARLISAAPDLLAALQEAIELIDQDENWLTPAGNVIVARWRAAIAKAEGSQS